jgi:hypothetical protein
MPNKKENPANILRLTYIINALQRMALTPFTAEIRNVYLDFGAGMKWDTIIIIKPNGDHYQCLNPRDWDIIMTTDSIAELDRIAEDLMFGKYGIDKLAR